MNTRSLLLAASATALLVSACSSPTDIRVPTLEPQFGSPDTDLGQDVALTSGGVYVLAEQSYNPYDEQFDGNGQEKALLKHYSSGGELLFSEEIVSFTCGIDNPCSGTDFNAESLHADASGSTYALIAVSKTEDDTYQINDYSVYKLNAEGAVVGTVAVGTTGRSIETFAPTDFLDVAVDKAGAIYVAKQQYDLEFDFDYNETYTNVIAKYTASGTLQWQRISRVGVPKGITVSDDGAVYVIGSSGISRYTDSGKLIWTRRGGGEDVTLSGLGVYVRNGITIRKYNASGRQLWARTQRGNDLVIEDMTGDARGNLYLSGRYRSARDKVNAFARKLNPRGTVLWTSTYGTPEYDDARGIATLDGSAIYTAGATQGSLAAKNLGGTDGYVSKLNARGNPVWTR